MDFLKSIKFIIVIILLSLLACDTANKHEHAAELAIKSEHIINTIMRKDFLYCPTFLILKVSP